VVTTTQTITNSDYRVSAGGGYSATGNVAVVTAIADTPVSLLSVVNDSPTPLGGATTLTATIAAGDNVTYTWALGDGAIVNGPAVSHTYPVVGVFTAIVTASNSINALTATTTVTITGAPN
jgi:hypothetical protein